MSDASGQPTTTLVPKDRQIMLLHYFDEYNPGERYGLKKSVLKFYKDHNTGRLHFDFISVHSIYSGIASFARPNAGLGYVRLLGKHRQNIDANISNRPDTVLLQFFNQPKSGYYEGLVLYSSEGDATHGKGKPYIAAKKILVEESAITDQEPNMLARTYCRSVSYAQLNDATLFQIHDRCMHFEVRNGILFLIGP